VAVSLRPMDASEVDEFIDASRAAYIAERVTAGDDPAEAAHAVADMSREIFPGGKPAPGHLLYAVVEDGRRVGSLWIGSASEARPGEWWVWDVVIDESARGRGIGRACMLLAEQEAAANGASRLGLSVFAHNPVATHLYESLGYETVSRRMSKTLRERR
jgi:ribosomal protein S18 acetylase RimI-like enzyme